MAEQELNKKLAEWCFGEGKLDYTPLGAIGEKVWAWVKWEGVGQPPIDVIQRRKPVPIDFPNDLNACFKWLVPKLQNKGYMVELYSYEQKGYKVSIYHITGQVDIPIVITKDDNPALALCKAIEQLIDKEK